MELILFVRVPLVDAFDLTTSSVNNMGQVSLFVIMTSLSLTSIAGNCWATGFYDRGEALMEVLMDSVRREVERCDNLMGFQVFFYFFYSILFFFLLLSLLLFFFQICLTVL